MFLRQPRCFPTRIVKINVTLLPGSRAAFRGHALAAASLLSI
jgi:hypothetical protein